MAKGRPGSKGAKAGARFGAAPRLPEVMLVKVTSITHDGDAVAKPVGWKNPGPPPVVYMAPEKKGQPPLAPGQQVMAKLKPIGRGRYEGRTVKRISEHPGVVLGLYRQAPQGGRIVPVDRRLKSEWYVPPEHTNGAKPDDIVRGEPMPGPALGLKWAKITEVLGRMGDARSVSLLCIATHGIPDRFNPAAIESAEAATGVGPQGREDLRNTHLITIDGEDARDFDDAVFAEPVPADPSKDWPGGWRLIVAIADVAHYVRPHSPLDVDARARGNSVYFPDRVVPMLPEALSNGWCSLKPDEDRGCLFVEMWVDEAGVKRRHRFGRGLMRSAARLTYEQAQAIAEDRHAASPALVTLTGALYAAFQALLAARQKRGTLDLDLPERKVAMTKDGQVQDVTPRVRLDSHRLIEEFMILANVAAAEELERRKMPCMYRIHAPPSEEKLFNLRTVLKNFGISLTAGGTITPADLDHVLKQVAGKDHAPLVNEMVLRSQSQAAYSPDNIGHFGLSLMRYAHFTSPIRRYADLLVHRALLGDLPPEEGAQFGTIGEHITSTERRAALAERDAIDRYMAAYMAAHRGSVFPARISGVTRAGLFVTLEANGANGFVPLSTLPDDDWMHDQVTQTLTARRRRTRFALAQPVLALLHDANPITGSMIFHLVQSTETTGTKRRNAASARAGGKSGT